MTRAPNSNPPRGLALFVACALCAACASDPGPTAPTADLSAEIVTTNAPINTDRDQAISAYRDHLVRYPNSAEYDAVSRRLADLLLEQAAELQLDGTNKAGKTDAREAYSEAIGHYENLLAKEPPAADRSELLYQLSRAHEESGSSEEALASIARLLQQEQDGSLELHADTLFRRGELMFSSGDYPGAAQSYQSVIDMGPSTPAYEQSLYKLGWSLFKQERYRDALRPMFLFLDLKLPPSESYEQQLALLSAADGEQVADMLRVISMSFAQLGGLPVVDSHFGGGNRHSYERQVYLGLAGWYEEQGQVSETVAVLLTLARREPLNTEAPRLTARAMDLYEEAGFRHRLTAVEIEFAQAYGVDSVFWTIHSPEDFPDVLAVLRASMWQLATTFHSEAQRTGNGESGANAEHWYRQYLAVFGNEAGAAEVHYRLAELLYESGRYQDAMAEYDLVARTGDPHSRAAEAALGAIYASDQLLQSSDPALRATLAQSATARDIQFITSHPENPLAPQLLIKAGTSLLEERQYQRALELGLQVVSGTPPPGPEMTRVGWSLAAQASFAMGDHPAAARAYQEALRHTDADNAHFPALQEGLAMAIYQQAGQALSRGDEAQAITLYQQASEIAPNTALRASATYDAATVLLAQRAWVKAIDLLKQYQIDYPQGGLQAEASKKLAYAYEQKGDKNRAVLEYFHIGQDQQQPEPTRREALIRASELAPDTGDVAQSIRISEYYLGNFPQPADVAIKQMQLLASLESGRGNDRRRRHWLKEITNSAKAVASPEISKIAAEAALELAEYQLRAFQLIQLVDPVQDNLLRKIEAMERALQAFELAASYRIAPVTTAANYHIASMYAQLSAALFNSERPAGLTTEELAEYDLLLAEQAGPFEQQAIDIYTTNTQGQASTHGDPWVEKSAQQLLHLQQLQSGR